MQHAELVELIQQQIQLAGKKLSEFDDGGNPDGANYLCAANAGVNQRYLLSAIAKATNTQTNLVYFSNAGENNTDTHNGTMALPYQDPEFARAQCALLNPSPSNQFTLMGDGGEYTLTDWTITPFINLNMNGGRLIFENGVMDGNWETEPQGTFNFLNSEIGMILPGEEYVASEKKSAVTLEDFSNYKTANKESVTAEIVVPIFNLNLQFANNAYFINFDGVKIINNFNWDIKLTDATVFLFNNIFDKTSFPAGTSNQVNVDGGNFYVTSSRAFDLIYTKSVSTQPTQLGVIGSIIQTLKIGSLSSDMQLATFSSIVFTYDFNNTDNHIFWVYDVASYNHPTSLIGNFPSNFAANSIQGIQTIPTNTLNFAKQGDDSINDGSIPRPFATYEKCLAQCVTNGPSENNPYTIKGDGNNYYIENLEFVPWVNFDANGGTITFTNIIGNGAWLSNKGGLDFINAKLIWQPPLELQAEVSTLKEKKLTLLDLFKSKKSKEDEDLKTSAISAEFLGGFEFDVKTGATGDYAHYISFNNIILLNDFDFNLKLTDSTFFIINNSYDKESLRIGGINNIFVENGNFYLNNYQIGSIYYTNPGATIGTSVYITNSFVGEVSIADSIDVIVSLLTLKTIAIAYTFNNTSEHLSWSYDSISYVEPSGVTPVTMPPSGGLTRAQSITTGYTRNNYTTVADPVTGQINLESEFKGIDNALISSALNVDYNATNYTPTSSKLNGHLQGIDAALTGGGGGGDVVGPGSAVSGNIVAYDGITGKLIADSGVFINTTGPLSYLQAVSKALTLYGDTAVSLDSGADINLISTSGNIVLDTIASELSLQTTKILNIHSDDALTLSSGDKITLDSIGDSTISADTGILNVETIGADFAIVAPASTLKIKGDSGVELEYNSGDLKINNVIATTKTSIPTAWTGIWALPQGGNVNYTIIGDQVFLDISAGILATASISSFIQCSPALPANLRPTTPKYFSVVTMDNSVQSINVMKIDTTGLIYIYGSGNLGNFSGTSTLGNSGFFETGVRYFI